MKIEIYCRTIEEYPIPEEYRTFTWNTDTEILEEADGVVSIPIIVPMDIEQSVLDGDIILIGEL